MAPGGRSGQIFEFLRFWEGLVISITRQVCRTTVMNHIATLVYIQTSYLALGGRFGWVLVVQSPLFLPCYVAIFGIDASAALLGRNND